MSDIRLIDANALKKALKDAHINMALTFDISTFNYVMNTIDNAPTVEPKKEIVPVCKVTFDKEQLQEIVDKKVAEMLERPQGELTELTDEVWKLYKKHQSHLATYVLEFGEELADLLGKYNEGGAEC